MGSIIQPGHGFVVSFNDDTCPHTLFTSGAKVFINAQVMPVYSLDWYHTLLSISEGVPGELKYDGVWRQFQALPSDQRSSVWAGLSRVRIHIVDPRPYREHIYDVLRSAWRRQNAPELLAHMRAERVPGAEALSSRLTEFVADSILRDSTAVRAQTLARVIGPNFQIFGIDADLDPAYFPVETSEIDVRSFGRTPGAVVRSVSQWSAKSAAAFHPVLDCLDHLGPDLASARFSVPQIIRMRMVNGVLDSHAFDEGNARHVELLESARSRLLSSLMPGGGYGFVPGRRPYAQIDSRGSYLIQAADIAAGIASHLFALGGLVPVVSHFEYVTHNGSRLSYSEAEEQQRLSQR